MFKNFAKLFRRGDKPVACADTATTEAPKARRGRPLSELAVLAHASVEAVLNGEPMTRSKILATLSDESQRTYVDANWQNVIGRLLDEGKAKLAEGAARGRGVAYQKAS